MVRARGGAAGRGGFVRRYARLGGRSYEPGLDSAYCKRAPMYLPVPGSSLTSPIRLAYRFSKEGAILDESSVCLQSKCDSHRFIKFALQSGYSLYVALFIVVIGMIVSFEC
ncbi:unnamed protein product [Colias eurytheme]|nr:unnamed protein product [Colias eurytheme]